MFRHRLSFGCVDLFICYDFVEAGRRAARHVGHTSFAWFMVWARVARLASPWPLLGAWPLVGLSWVALARLVLCWALLGCPGPLLGLSWAYRGLMSIASAFAMLECVPVVSLTC